ncbi:hypothetical protein M9Y10_036255 [Tritrichomonas musculus]|uniref:Uncharacterized protein n=1 Tax=Tritrichomonas musculus TaxID=1915356 RepID=A0ABR2GUU7_9EUKA
MSKKQRDLTPEERDKILKNTPPYIEKCGVKNHERAKYISMISKEVIGSDNFKFSSMQSLIRDHHDYLEWNMAYTIVKNFLKDNNCVETLKVIDYEFDNKLNPIQHPEYSPENYEGNSEQFDSLLDSIPTKTEAKFSNRLQMFLPYLAGNYNPEEDDFEEDNFIQNDGGAFLTQPAATQEEVVDGEDAIIDNPEEDIDEVFSLNDFDSDENNNE